MKKKRASVELQDSTRINEMLLQLNSNELKEVNIQDQSLPNEGPFQKLKKTIKLRQLLRALITNQSLSRLSLKECDLQEKELIQLASVLENKTDVEFHLSHLKNQRSGDRSAIAISRMVDSLKSVDLRENAMSEKGALLFTQALLENTSVKKLNLSGNEIGSVSVMELAKVIRQNKSLIEVSLNNNKIRFVAIRELARAVTENTTLTRLFLRNNRIGDEGAIAFANTLIRNTTLQTLDLSNNLIEENGILALAQALKKNTTLIRLDLSLNQFSDPALDQLAEALEKNTTIMELRIYDKPPENPHPSWTRIRQSLFRNRVSVPLKQAKALLNNQDNPKDFQKITEHLQQAFQMSLTVTDHISQQPEVASLMRETTVLLIQTYLQSNNLKGLLDYYKNLKNPPTELSTQLAEAIAAQDTSTSLLKTQEKWELVLYLLQNTDNTRLKSYALYHLKEAFAGNTNPKGLLTEKDSFESMAKAIYQDPNTPPKLKQIIEIAMAHDDPRKTPGLQNMPSFFSKKHGAKLMNVQKENLKPNTHPVEKPNQNPSGK